MAAAVCGLIGTLVGILLTGLLTRFNSEAQERRAAALRRTEQESAQALLAINVATEIRTQGKLYVVHLQTTLEDFRAGRNIDLDRFDELTTRHRNDCRIAYRDTYKIGIHLGSGSVSFDSQVYEAEHALRRVIQNQPHADPPDYPTDPREWPPLAPLSLRSASPSPLVPPPFEQLMRNAILAIEEADHARRYLDDTLLVYLNRKFGLDIMRLIPIVGSPDPPDPRQVARGE
ncbi:hypothetical protein [Streptomyces sp. NPDC051214]|uniref:hypothetical protein n=1 Tax=Streptomyces sp. NPDC051214 TaxID=3155282 RepID=UPI00341FC2F5